MSAPRQSTSPLHVRDPGQLNVLQCPVLPAVDHPSLSFMDDPLPTITTDKTVYEGGETVRICYTVPWAGTVTITGTRADGMRRVLLDVYDDGTGWCFDTTAVPLAARECLSLNYDGGSNSAWACFEVREPQSIQVPAPGSASLQAGEVARFSFSVPCPSPITGPDGRTIQPSCGCCGPRVLTVANASDQPALVSYDRQFLTIEVPSGFAVQVSGAAPQSCSAAADRPHVLTCGVAVTGAPGRDGRRITLTTVALDR